MLITTTNNATTTVAGVVVAPAAFRKPKQRQQVPHRIIVMALVVLAVVMARYILIGGANLRHINIEKPMAKTTQGSSVKTTNGSSVNETKGSSVKMTKGSSVNEDYCRNVTMADPNHYDWPIRNVHKLLGAAVAVHDENNGTTTTELLAQSPPPPMMTTEWPVSHFMMMPDPIIIHQNASSSSSSTAAVSSGENATAAVCKIVNDTSLLQHFPHAAQRLFRCWSYWRHRPNVPPVLYWQKAPVSWRSENNNNSYVAALLDLWKSKLNLTIVDDDNDDNKGSETTTTAWDVGGMVPRVTAQDPFALAAVDDARAFRALIVSDADDDRRDHHHDPLRNCDTAPPPRIAILNRQKKRRIVDAPALASAIAQALDRVPADIPVVYFEDSTFAYQMQFMAHTDIVISPHGAQLTSIIAMPPCGGLLEIYPPNYYPVSFFASLADASGILHQTMYLGGGGGDNNSSNSNNNWTTNNSSSSSSVDQDFTSPDAHQRWLDRSVPLCPDVDEVVRLTVRLVAARVQCCHAAAAAATMMSVEKNSSVAVPPKH